MFYVLLNPSGARPYLPGVRHSVFFFYTEAEAEEFASTLHAKFPGVETEEGQAGTAQSVFEDWSF